MTRLRRFEQESLLVITERVAKGFGLPMDWLRDADRNTQRRVFEARAVLCWLADKTTTLRPEEVSKWLNIRPDQVCAMSLRIEQLTQQQPAYLSMVLTMAPTDFERRRDALAIVNTVEASGGALKRGLDLALEEYERRLIDCLAVNPMLTLDRLVAALKAVEAGFPPHERAMHMARHMAQAVQK